MGVTTNKVTKTGQMILTASFPVGITCRPDAPCSRCTKEGGGCYGNRGHMAARNYKESMMKNLKLYNESPESYYYEIHNRLLLVPYKFFRWFVTGDIPDDRFLPEVAVRLAVEHSNTFFLMFTKKFELINKYLDEGREIPSNLKIILSCWGNFIPENPYNLPMSYVRFKDDSRNANIPKDAKPCKGKCEMCVNAGGGCWNLQSGESVVFNKH